MIQSPRSYLPDSMSRTHSFLPFLVLLLVFSTEGALFGYYMAHCQFTSPDGHDAVYVEQFYFNKVLEGQYNSSVGKVVGYTKNGIEVADKLNGDKDFMKREVWKSNLCKRNVPLIYDELQNSVEPYVWLRSVDAADSRHPSMLVCSAYNFYPKQIKLTWLRDGKQTTTDVTSTEELPNGNWLYQIHSYLEYTPKPEEKISCMVEHATLMKPMIYDWDDPWPMLSGHLHKTNNNEDKLSCHLARRCLCPTEPSPDSGRDKIAVGAAGLLLGLVFSVAGLIYYKKKSSGRVAVSTTEVLYPDVTL
ncbi:rano class II histocompatibility antigen, A beta chain-like isoform X2 [Oreochromis aureus]|uniref:Ig-like domain-containing protein n=1 Tax=Oreochromis aureus TaxID=47969 RepID=A0A668TDZ7_OREAU|nr:rano class II histocompatibility antigen, A beta chain-like isoform X2 [Oreochromis aureus]